MKGDHIMDNKVKAHIRSLGGKLAEVVIVKYENNNHVVAEYDGELHPAVFNPFVWAYYVDDTLPTHI